MDTEPTIPEDNDERKAYWQEHVDAWRQSHLSQREYARQHGLPIARFTYWKNKLYPNTRSSGFVELQVESTAPVRIHHPSGPVIDCPPGTDVHWLRALLGIDHAS